MGCLSRNFIGLIVNDAPIPISILGAESSKLLISFCQRSKPLVRVHISLPYEFVRMLWIYRLLEVGSEGDGL